MWSKSIETLNPYEATVKCLIKKTCDRRPIPFLRRLKALFYRR